MPIITKYRTWCKTCGEWELHSSTMINNEEELVCDECGELHELYKFSEIPNEKLVEQRERYKETRFSHFKSVLFNQRMLNLNRFNDLNIIESDAGQKEIDEIIHEEYEKKRKELEEKRKLYEEKFKGVNRNDNCPCGKLDSNGKPFKYKKCCLSKFNYI